jgi:hypothetical protein
MQHKTIALVFLLALACVPTDADPADPEFASDQTDEPATGSSCETEDDCIASACVEGVCTVEQHRASGLTVKPEKQHFCCSTVWEDEKKGRQYGDGCIAVGKESIDRCANLLYCHGSYMKKDGITSCRS